MFKRVDAPDMSSLLLPMSRRRNGKGVFFVRLHQYNPQVKDTLWKYHEAARQKGTIIEGQIPNPDERQLRFLTETLGDAFQPDSAFVAQALQKWMPRMKPACRAEFADALCAQFSELRRAGKTDSILKNIYTKIMCWLYYKFERLMPFLGDDDPPRILYEATGITAHELILLRILSAMGADILLLEPAGDQAYLRHDPASQWSQALPLSGGAFPQGFTLKQFRKEMAAQAAPARPAPAAQPPRTPASPVSRPANAGVPQPVRTQGTPAAATPRPGALPTPPQQRRDPESYFPKPDRSACTNAWMKSASMDEILTPPVSRGDDFRLFYNAFIRIRGVPDQLTFPNVLFKFHQKLKSTGRNIVIVDGGLSLPAPEETGKIRRHPYHSVDEMIVDIARNLPACSNVELQRLIQLAFVRTMKSAAAAEPNMNRLLTSAVYLLCWILQYQSALFNGYKGNEIPCFILMGGCQNQHDALYMMYLSLLPVDVLIIASDLNRLCSLRDDRLLELSGNESLHMPKYPRDAASVQMGTIASGAERALDTLLYDGDSGLFRDHQFTRADALTLRTTYDEIFSLWEQEMKYRPNFGTVNQLVNMPVIYAEVCGIENGKVDAYWQRIKGLLGDRVKLYSSFPIGNTAGTPFQSLAIQTVKNGRMNREAIRNHPKYPFSMLRNELQEHIFDKIQLMLDRKLIKGTAVNGTEYTILSTILNLEKDLIRMLQSFDFTKLNPKLVVISASEQLGSLEDAILLTFLNLIGFDIVMFVPTGYQTIERFLNDNFPVTHKIGDYIFDLRVPDFSALPKGHSWFENILKRGR
ncbi:MAG: YceG family protein [Aristaeellaceae bacterium]